MAKRRRKGFGSPSESHTVDAQKAYSMAELSSADALGESERGACDLAANDLLTAAQSFGEGLAHIASGGGEPRSEKRARATFLKAEKAFKKACLVKGGR